MAILWSMKETLEGLSTRYEVRNAGATRRLYTNGAFHSQYNPHRLLAGGVWDLLTLPALYRENPIERVLMLGVGGGAAIHQYVDICKVQRITGIEFNPVHLRIAETFFECQGPTINLICADAYAWMKQSRSRFDVVIDDLFVDSTGDPIRQRAIDTRWMQRLAARLLPDGLVIQNHLATASARLVARDPWVRGHFASAILFSTSKFENAVLALYRSPINNRRGRSLAVKRIQETLPRAVRRLDFSGQQLF